MSGGDTYAYIDSVLADAHAEVNTDDPEGTRYLDVVANAMPFHVSATPELTLGQGQFEYISGGQPGLNISSCNLHSATVVPGCWPGLAQAG